LATDPPPDAAGAAPEAPPSGVAVVPIAPTPVPGLTPAPVAPSAPIPRADAEPTPTPAPAGQEAALPATPEPEPAPALPEGALALQRVGFSFVTGGAGACGVVLEPWRHVAVSRDLLAQYGCGAAVRITLDDPAGGRTEALATIADTMNPSFSRTVNVYVDTDEPAFAYGLTTGTFAPR
jgi:hypothetical protein